MSTPLPDPSASAPAEGADKARRKLRIGDLLVQHGAITEEQLQLALAEQKKRGQKLGNTLIDLGLVEEDQLLELLSEQLHVPLIDLHAIRLDPEVVRGLPETLARRYRVILLESREQDAMVGMADPTDLFAYDELRRHLGKRVRQAVVKESDLLRFLDLIYRSSDELSRFAGELEDELSRSDVDLNLMLQMGDSNDAPVFRLLQTLFEDAMKANASDIHIEPEEQVLRIRQRVDGVLQEQVMNEARIAPALVQRLKLLANLDISEKRLPQDGRFQLKLQKHQIDVRLSTMPVRNGEAVVMRLLDQSGGILKLEELGMDETLRGRIRSTIHQPHGLFLVTGPTGSGKTTTLYAALGELNRPERKIITIEDPIEYQLPRINQVQVHEQIGLDFARVLRTALRQDPEVLLIGEMRDLETVQIGLRAALTGHFVLSTLHTNGAVATVGRLLDMGAPGYLMASALRSVLAQRLVRRVCRKCGEPHQPTDQELTWLASMVGEPADGIQFNRGRGCSYCNQTGYRGRIGVYELLEVRDELLTLLRNEDLDGFARAARADPAFVSLPRAGLDLAERGLTTIEEVIRISGMQD